MGTTNLFVELVVIGIGAALWISEIVLACFGYEWIDAKYFQSTLATVVAVALIYILGIVTDRLADGFFEGYLSRKLKRRIYGSRIDEHQDDRRLLFGRPTAEVALFEYGRSRMRICRGWTANALLLAGATNILIWSRPQLKRTEFVRTRETAEFARRTSAPPVDAKPPSTR